MKSALKPAFLLLLFFVQQSIFAQSVNINNGQANVGVSWPNLTNEPYHPVNEMLKLTLANSQVVLCVDFSGTSTGTGVELVNPNGEFGAANYTQFHGFSNIQFNPSNRVWTLQHDTMQCFQYTSAKSQALSSAKGVTSCTGECIFMDGFGDDDGYTPAPPGPVDLQVAGEACPNSSPRDGESFCYNITVSNNGASTAQSVHIREFFPMIGSKTGGGYTVHGTASDTPARSCQAGGGATCGTSSITSTSTFLSSGNTIPAGGSVSWSITRQMVAENTTDPLVYYASAAADPSAQAAGTAEASTTQGNNITRVSVSQNRAPTISGLSATSFTSVEDGANPGPLTFNISDADGDLTNASCDNTVPNSTASGAYSLVTTKVSGDANNQSCQVVINLNANGNTGGSAETVNLALSDGIATTNSSFTVNVTPVNDAPSFTKGSNVSVNWNSGAHTISGWATNISKGPTADESTQTASFTVSNNNNGLFSVQPAVTSAGSLSFTVANNVSGSATVSLYLQDNGGTANGGANTSSTQNFSITVSANKAPSFTVTPSRVSYSRFDAGAQSTASIISNATPGDGEEGAQTLTWSTAEVSPAAQVVNNGSSGYSAGSNTLSYTLSGAEGTTEIQITADDGQTSNNLTMNPFYVDVLACQALPDDVLGWWPGQDVLNTNPTVTTKGYFNWLENNVDRRISPAGGTATFVNGKIGQAFSLNASTALVIKKEALETSTAFSMAFWYKTLASTGTVISNRTLNTSSFVYEGFDLSLSAGKLNLTINDVAIHSEFKSATGKGLVVSGSTSINDDQWHHIVISHDGGAGMEVFVDGVSELTTSAINVDIAGLMVFNGFWTSSNDGTANYFTVNSAGSFDEIMHTASSSNAAKAAQLQYYNTSYGTDPLSGVIGACFSDVQTCFVADSSATNCPATPIDTFSKSAGDFQHYLLVKTNQWNTRGVKVNIDLSSNLSVGIANQGGATCTGAGQSASCTGIDLSANGSTVLFFTSSGSGSWDSNAMGVTATAVSGDYDWSNNAGTVGDPNL